MSKLKQIIAAIVLVAGIGTVAVVPAYAACSSASDCISKGVNASGGNSSSSTDPADIIKLVVNILLFIIGAVSVIMIILGGIRYTISQGDSGKVATAKNTILYAIVGLGVALFAYAIVNFVLTNLG
jgi:hypothetical protein